MVFNQPTVEPALQAVRANWNYSHISEEYREVRCQSSGSSEEHQQKADSDSRFKRSLRR